MQCLTPNTRAYLCIAIYSICISNYGSPTMTLLGYAIRDGTAGTCVIRDNFHVSRASGNIRRRELIVSHAELVISDSERARSRSPL